LIPVDAQPDAQFCVAATEFNISLHGESYHIKVNGTGYHRDDKRAFYINVDGLPEEIMVETLDEIINVNDPQAAATLSKSSNKGSKRPKASAPGHVTTSMPGMASRVRRASGRIELAKVAMIVTSPALPSTIR